MLRSFGVPTSRWTWWTNELSWQFKHFERRNGVTTDGLLRVVAGVEKGEEVADTCLVAQTMLIGTDLLATRLAALLNIADIAWNDRNEAKR